MRTWMVLMTIFVAFGAPWGASPVAAFQVREVCQSSVTCDDGLFCNGEETCSGQTCRPGAYPCPGRACDEDLDLCLPGQNPQLEAGWLEVGASPEIVLLANRYDRPVVVLGAHPRPGDPPLVARIAQVNEAGLEIYLQSPSGAAVPGRRVSYLVVEEGVWEVEGLKFEAQRFSSSSTDQEGQLTGQRVSYLHTYEEPVVVGQVQTSRDDAWSVFWAAGNDAQQPPLWWALTVGKTVGADPQPARQEEELGFVVFESGRYSIQGFEIEAGVTTQAVVGLENQNQPYVQSFWAPFDQPPEVGIVSTAGLAQGEVAWPVIPLRPNGGVEAIASVTGLPLAVDEDQLGDAERIHGPERVAYFVADRAFSYQSSPFRAQGAIDPWASTYYTCRLDPSATSHTCSNAVPGIQQAVAACEAEVDTCASFVDVGGACGSCLLPFPSWKKLPLIAFVTCAASCGQPLYDFFACRDNAEETLRSAVQAEICSACGGAECGDRYGIEVTVSGLACDEAVTATTRCSSDSTARLSMLPYFRPSLELEDYCPYPDGWEVQVGPVVDVKDGSMKRECSPRQGRSGVAAVGSDIQASFDCSCSGAGCGEAASVSLVGEVAGCMPQNSWFRLTTTVTDSCGGNPRVGETLVYSDDASPFSLNGKDSLKARPGDLINVQFQAVSAEARCWFEGDDEVTLPADPPPGDFTVVRVRCEPKDPARANSCEPPPGQLTLTGSVEGDGLDIRPSGVTVVLNVEGENEELTVSQSPSDFDFTLTASPGDTFSVSIADPTYEEGRDPVMVSSCSAVVSDGGQIPSDASSPYEVVRIVCSTEAFDNDGPPGPDDFPEPVPPLTTWNWDPVLECDYVCDPNDYGGSTGYGECPPCLCPPDTITGLCPQTCFCETTEVIAGACQFDCDLIFNLTPSLSVSTSASSASGQSLEADDSFKMSATASDGDGLQGFVVAVDGEYVGHRASSGTQASFNDLTIDTSGLSPGSHTLRVIALDDHPQAPIPAYVDIPFDVAHVAGPCQSDSTPPAVSIWSPAAGSTLSPGTVAIQASASDATGVKEVRFWAGAQLLGTDALHPYSRSWTATPGTHRLRARATDHCNNSREAEITVTVADPCSGPAPPTVTITNYQDGQWVDPGLFHFEASAVDHSGSGIDRVEFEVESFSNVAVDATAPYLSSGWWLTQERPEVITARAYDGCGRVGTDTITLNVNESASICSLDSQPPQVTLTAPTDPMAYPAGPVAVTASASDDSVLLAAVLEVGYSVVPDSTILSSNPANYAWTWDASPGLHFLRVKVVDVCWRVGWSLPQLVYVE